MKKFILERDTGDLIPWSEYVHDTDDTRGRDSKQNVKDDLDKEEKVEMKNVEDPEGENIDEKAEDTVKGATDTVKGDIDEVVIKNIDDEQLGPPGIRSDNNKKKKRKKKERSSNIDDKKGVDAGDGPVVKKKRAWVNW